MPLPSTRSRLTTNWLLFLTLAVAFSASAAPLRIASFNVENGLYATNAASYTNVSTILKRINADVVGLCELMVRDSWTGAWVGDNTNFPVLASELGLPHRVYDTDADFGHFAGIASRYPIAQTIWVYNSGMTRRIPLVRLTVPDTPRNVWVAMLHLKAKHSANLSEQHTRAAELFWLRQAITNNCNPTNDIIMIMGDFNMVSPTDVVFSVPLYTGVTYPLNAPKDANGYFVDEGIFKLDLRHAGTGGETWTWRSDGIFPNGALDHMMVSAPVRSLGVASEIYDVKKDATNVEGLAKYGTRPSTNASYGSDHLPIFADLQMNGTPAVTATPSSLADFLTMAGSPSSPKTISVSGADVYSNVTITAPTGFAVSKDGTNYTNSVTLAQFGGVVTPTTLYVRLTGASGGAYSGNMTVASAGAAARNVAVSGTVFTPTVTAEPATLPGLNTTSGVPSAAESFTVGGTNLSASMTISPPPGYEVASNPNRGYANSVTLSPSNGTVSPTTIFVRLTGASAGSFSGNITVASTGATTQTVAVSGIVENGLYVDASAALATEGPAGGPFTPASATYVLYNTSTESLDWTAESSTTWITLSASSGSLPAGASTAVVASLNAEAGRLLPGDNRAVLSFVNRSNGLGSRLVEASVFVSPYTLDGIADSEGYLISSDGITLRAALRGTRLYVATQSAANNPAGNDHHILISDTLLQGATAPAAWAKRGMIAVPDTSPYLAAEGGNDYAGWFNVKNSSVLGKSLTRAGVLEGSIDMVEEFGAVPEFIYIAAVAYETSDASTGDPSLGRIVSQVPAAKLVDDNIAPDEFLKIPVRSVTDSAADGKFDIVVPDRAFKASLAMDSATGPWQVRWNSVPGRTYRVWRRSDLASGVWQQLGDLTAAPGQWEASLPDSLSTGTRSFYQLELLGPGF